MCNKREASSSKQETMGGKATRRGERVQPSLRLTLHGGFNVSCPCTNAFVPQISLIE